MQTLKMITEFLFNYLCENFVIEFEFTWKVMDLKTQ